MSIFNYQATTKEGRFVKGTIKALDRERAAQGLIQRGLSPIALEVKEKGGLSLEISFFNRVSFKELVFFCRQLSIMISAAMPLPQSLKLLSEQTTNKYFAKILNDLARKVEQGTRFSKALKTYPRVFSNYFIGMVKTGESSGSLKDSLEYLAAELEGSYGLRSKVISALIYPAFLISALLGVGTLMMVMVLPGLTDILTQGGVKLPITTRILIGTSHFLRQDWYLALGGLAIIVVLSVVFSKMEQGKRFLDHSLLKIPLISRLVRTIYITRITSSLGTLLKGGLPVLTSLRLVGDSLSNAVYQEIILKIAEDVENGDTIAASLARFPHLMPLLMVQMVRVGEKTGKMDDVLLKMSKFYKRSSKNLLKNLVSLLEPIILIIMGIGVGIMVSAIILPIYQVAMHAAK